MGDILRDRSDAGKVQIRSVSLLGQKKLDQNTVNLVRAIVKHPGTETEGRYDFSLTATQSTLLADGHRMSLIPNLNLRMTRRMCLKRTRRTKLEWACYHMNLSPVHRSTLRN